MTYDLTFILTLERAAARLKVSLLFAPPDENRYAAEQTDDEEHQEELKVKPRIVKHAASLQAG